MKLATMFLLGALCLYAGDALSQNAQPSVVKTMQAPSSAPHLGVFYYDHSRNTSSAPFEFGGLVMNVISYLSHSTPELKRISIAERDQLAPLIDLDKANSLLTQALIQSGGGAAKPFVRYGMSQDMSAFIVIAELHSSSSKEMQPITLVYQSRVHEIAGKTSDEIALAVADVERRKPEMKDREYRKKLESARSVQRDWSEIYRAHAHYWEDNAGSRLQAELEQAVDDMTAMANFVFDNSPNASEVGLETRIKEVVAQEGSHRLRVERSNLLVAKDVNDPDYFGQWNVFLD